MNLKHLLTLTTLALMTNGGGNLMAQTDVTADYIKNAGFDTESDFQTEVKLLNNDYTKASVSNWTSAISGTWGAGGVIGVGTANKITYANSSTSVSAPSANSDGDASGGVLGLAAAWGGSAAYTQSVTLPAGVYTFETKVQSLIDRNNGVIGNSKFTFLTEEGFMFGFKENKFPVNQWVTNTLKFSLATETKGTLSIGFTHYDTNSGSGTTQVLVVDYVKAYYNGNYTTTLESAIDRATKLYARIADNDLNDAINSAKAVLNASDNSITYQTTIDNEVATLRAAIVSAQAKVIFDGEEDITYLLENSNFEVGNPVSVGVCTYDYDCAKNATFNCWMQQVEGWTAVNNSEGKAAGVIAYESNAWIGGPSYSASSVTSSLSENNALALVGAWTGTVQYKQAVTLPAGVYVLTVPVFNSNGSTAISKNLIGFVTDAGTEYLATTTQYPVGSTKTETINFTLDEETTGYISLGYTAANTGSGNCPKMFIDAITIKYFTADKSSLFDEIAKAQTYQEVLSNNDLATAITTAQGVYDNTQALQSAVDAQVTALETAIHNALQNIANGTNVTALFVANNSFEDGATSWTWKNASDTGVKEDSNTTYATEGADGSYLFNTWGGTNDKYVNQSLTGLPDGYYVVSALVASDYPNSVTLYAGEGKNDVDVDFAGKGVFISGVSGIAQPTEGALEIGATSTNWYKADKFQLMYYTTEANAQAAIDAANLAHAMTTYNKALAAAKALSNDAITGKEKVDIDAAIDADDTLDKTSANDVDAATDVLYSASAVFTAAASAYERAAFAITKATAASVDATALSTLKTATTTVAADLTEPTNTLLAAVINSYAPGEFGFEAGEYAPYNNVEGLTVLAIANEVESKTTEEITTAITTLTEASWTANTADVDAIYNGMFITSQPGDRPLAWTRSSNWGQLRSEVAGDYATAFYNQPGSISYGDDGVYTMPLAANTIYKLSFAYRSHENNSNKGVKASVLNGEDGLAEVSFPANGSTSEWTVVEEYFATVTAGNYVLTLANSGNTWMTGVSLVKVDALEFADGSVPSYAPGTYPTVKITRSLTADKWATAVYPFAVSGVDNIAVLSSYDKATGALGFTSADASTANVPFLMRSTSDKTEITLSNVAVADAAATDATASEASLKGVYDVTEIDNTAKNYVLSNNTIYPVGKAGATINPYRAYIQIAQDAPVRALSFFIDGIETGIETIDNGQLTIDNAAIYNLAGQRVQKAQKGLYIVNGKKIVVK